MKTRIIEGIDGTQPPSHPGSEPRLSNLVDLGVTIIPTISVQAGQKYRVTFVYLPATRRKISIPHITQVFVSSICEYFWIHLLVIRMTSYFGLKQIRITTFVFPWGCIIYKVWGTGIFRGRHHKLGDNCSFTLRSFMIQWRQQCWTAVYPLKRVEFIPSVFSHLSCLMTYKDHRILTSKLQANMTRTIRSAVDKHPSSGKQRSTIYATIFNQLEFVSSKAWWLLPFNVIFIPIRYRTEGQTRSHQQILKSDTLFLSPNEMQLVGGLITSCSETLSSI